MNGNRMLIVLYGTTNQGKTTTIKELALILACSKPISNSLRSKLYGILPNTGKKRDGRIIVEYKDKLIYLATGGYSWAISRGNTDFFEGKMSSIATIYRITSTDIVELSNNEKNNYKGKKPDICICACSPNSDRTGAIKALHMYCEEAINNRYRYQLWLQKEAGENNVSKADEVKDIIDRFISKGII